jgi:RHS repeat-associated protein
VGQLWRTYYYAGGQRIAVRERTATTDELTYLHGDHLGSASLATDASGGVLSEMRYTPYGETRAGDMATDRRYTCQRWEDGLGLYDYNARYYDPALGRFISADTLVPSPGDPQSLNRYAYTLNNPLKYIDPDGHFPWLFIPVIAGYAMLLTRSNATPDPAHAIANLTVNASTDADALVVMFAATPGTIYSSDSLSGETAQGRFEAILGGTRGLPGQYFRGQFGGSGFQQQFQDGYLYQRYWQGGTDQVGHFLTAAGMAYRSYDRSILEQEFLKLVIGHEMVGDQHGTFAQRGAATSEAIDLFVQAVAADTAGNYNLRDAHLRGILGTTSLENRRGNSLEDLRLTVRGWRFGQMIASGELATHEDAAAWLEEYIRVP